MTQPGIITALIALPMALALPAKADALRCDLAPEGGGEAVVVSFEIDRTQFAGAVNEGDPPRKQITEVTLGDETIQAEPFLADGGYRGFLREDETGLMLMVVDIDGLARLSRSTVEQDLVGTCEDRK